MPKPKIKGKRGVFALPIEITFDPRGGQNVTSTFRSAGTSAALVQQYLDARAAGYRGRIRLSPIVSELQVESPEPIGDETDQAEHVSDTWQIVGNEIHKSIFENPFTISVFGQDLLDDIAQAIRGAGPDGPTKPDSVDDPDREQLWNEIVAGQDSVATGQYVLKHTTNCSARSTVNVSDFNVEKLYTTAQLLSEVQSTSLWIQPLPTRLYNKILSIATPPGIDIYHLWSWRKLPSTETLTPNNRIEINTEYWLDAWSILRYDVVT